MWDILKSKEFRFWLYGITSAVTAIMGAYGYIEDSKVALWNLLASAVLMVAANNTGTRIVKERNDPYRGMIAVTDDQGKIKYVPKHKKD